MPKKIAVIGGGFSGTMVIRQLIDHGFQGSIDLFHVGSVISNGPAYSENIVSLLLNVRSANMSAFPDDPTHFLRFLQQEHPLLCDETAFVARNIYGAYLKKVWEETLSLAQNQGCNLTIHEKSFAPSSSYSHLILATGNDLPRIPKSISLDVQQSELFHGNPWVQGFELFDSEKPIFILGNGLTMVDTVLKLRQAGAKQPIVALSRHGYHMLPHPPKTEQALNFEVPDQANLSQLLTYFKQQRQSLSLEHFLHLIDACRPKIATWWQGFTAAEQEFFMRHLRHLWGTVRHRIPQEISEKIQHEQASGSLFVLAGKLLTAERCNEQLRLVYQSNGVTKTMEAACIINCTGPETSIERMSNPTIRLFLEKKWIRADQTNQGILMDSKRHLVQGLAPIPIYAIGNLCKGTLWESTAIGELRSQAKLIAKDLLDLK